ncbi:uncharacterized protein LOC129599262 [Paramacrobiotus metropolitanus]|uniref:uncharacterized protein LOC129599262 n=1 Tax=Paramacrobiotus metropolitanus TaxID=2943436 RepID=UPI002445CC06|nr:uncharacterized protein LOC129599262 [Paramacrobiotus metropolitanus]
MNATPRYLRHLLSGARQTSYGNTVLVKRDNGQWWLGYVQDIEADNFFIDFDASTISAQWIHTSHLWPHHIPGMFRGHSEMVALRDEIVRVNEESSDTPEQSPQTSTLHLVHHTQFASAPYESDCFFGRTTWILYKKHVISYPKAHLLREVDFLPTFLANESRHRGCDEVYGFRVGCRVFVRADSDTITFICAEVHGETNRNNVWANENAAHSSMFWNEDALKEACENYLTAQLAEQSDLVQVPPISLPQGLVEPVINDLPHPILAWILLNLDVDSQLKTHRVCAQWRLLLLEQDWHRHIIFDSPGMCTIKSYDEQRVVDKYYRSFKFMTILNHTVNENTQTLALIDEGEYGRSSNCSFDIQDKMWGIKILLKTKSICLPRIIILNGSDAARTSSFSLLALNRNNDTGEYECHALSKLMKVCEELLLINYNASEAINGSAFSILCKDQAHMMLRERDLIRLRDYVRPDVIIPFLRFRSTETAAEQCRRFLAAANDNCPPITQHVREKVTAIHARWLRTFKYPEEWSRIPIFLEIFNSFGPDENRVRWDTMDLRQLDISALSRVTFAALDGCLQIRQITTKSEEAEEDPGLFSFFCCFLGCKKE